MDLKGGDSENGLIHRLHLQTTADILLFRYYRHTNYRLEESRWI